MCHLLSIQHQIYDTWWNANINKKVYLVKLALSTKNTGHVSVTLSSPKSHKCAVANSTVPE